MTTPTTCEASTDAHFRRLSRAQFAALWADRSMTVDEVGRIVGLSRRGTTRRAAAYGLALRGKASKRPTIKDTDAFALLWREGVATQQIAEHFGVSNRTVANTVTRLCLQNRQQGERPRVPSVAAALMLQAAKAEQARLREREMIDAVRKVAA